MSRRTKRKRSMGNGLPRRSNFIANRSRKASRSQAASRERWISTPVCIFLALAVWAIFGQTFGFGFVNYDDGQYVYYNPQITHGLSLKAILWAFTHIHSGNWHPLTTLTHMFDCQMYGLNPWGHHLGNVLLHGMTAILLFLVLRQMTGALWCSAFVAAVFAVHPLHVESVAWISERKDVLSGLFFMLTLMAYVRYVRTRGSGPEASLAFFRFPAYWVALLLFALGLMSKPMLVTLPFVLLLLDWWPLERFTISNARSAMGPLGWEKIPFVLLSTLSCAATIWAQKNSLNPLQEITFPERVCNALISYSAYVGQMLYPIDLAVFYPHPLNQLPVWMVCLSALTLLIISAVVLAVGRKHPFLPVGWLWYLGMLVPVIGLVQVGVQARADRYTYLPQIGLYIAVAWGAVDLSRPWRYHGALLAAGAAVILASLLILAHVQTTYWKDSVSLMTHAIACTSDNSVAENNLGNALVDQGKPSEAIKHLERVLQLRPDSANAYYNLGLALAHDGKLPEAIQHYEQALQLNPEFAEANNNLANTLANQGKLPEAIQRYERALQLKPDYAEAYTNLGSALAREGKLAEAIQHYERALQLKPDYAEAYNNLGIVLVGQGKLPEAIQRYERALQLKPDYALANNNLGDALAAQGRLPEAIQRYERALQLTGGENPVVLETLAAAYAKAGRYREAVQTVSRAIERAGVEGNSAQVSTLQSRLELYKTMQSGEGR